MNRHFLIILDKTIFRLAFSIIAALSKLRRKKINMDAKLGPTPCILVIRPGGLGDGIMCIPFLRTLRDLVPQATIIVVCVSKNQEAFSNIPYYDKLIILDDFSKLPVNFKYIIEQEIEIVFDLEPFRRISTLVAWATRAPVRVGFDTNSRRKLYTHLVTYANDNRFETSNMLHQLRVIGYQSPEQDQPYLTLPLADEAKKRAKKLLENSALDPSKHFLVAFAVGVLKPHHRWINSRFAELIDLIINDDLNTEIILIGTARDTEVTDEVLHHVRSNDRNTNLVGQTDFQTSMGLLHNCDILIGCDGGIIHMAAAMGCATISLWGPGVMERFKPPGKFNIGIRKDFACVPCVTWDRLGEFPRCPYNRRCYNDITADEVFQSYRELKKRLGNERRIGEGSVSD